MLENIVTNPIDTPRGMKNPSKGIALRGLTLPKQTANNTNDTPVNDDQIQLANLVHNLNEYGGGRAVVEHQNGGCCMVLHPRTLRKARKQVKSMVNSGVSLPRIKNTLHRFVLWWQKTSTEWSYQNILRIFVSVCKAPSITGIAADLFRRATSKDAVLFQGLNCTLA